MRPLRRLEDNKHWSGIIPALVTPLRPDRSVDAESLERIVAHAVRSGVHGFSALGSTGEGALLSASIHAEALQIVLDAARGWPVIASVLNPVPCEAMVMAKRALDLGVNGIMLTPPFYYALDQDSIVDFYSEAARTLRQPIIVYHIPSLTKISLATETVVRLANLSEVVGIKDSSRDLPFHQRIIEETRGMPFGVFAGSGSLLSSNFSWGGAGAIAASANLIPSALVRLWDALLAREPHEAARLQEHIDAVEDLCRHFPFPVNWKTSLELVGLISATPAFPLRRLLSTSSETMRAGLQELGIVS